MNSHCRCSQTKRKRPQLPDPACLRATLIFTISLSILTIVPLLDAQESKLAPDDSPKKGNATAIERNDPKPRDNGKGAADGTPITQALASREAATWPTLQWPTADPASVGLDPGRLERAMDYAFARSGDDKDRKGIRTDAVVLIKDGKLVAERYARGFTATTRHLSWSMAKSFVNALYGIAVKDGLVSLEDPAYKYYPLLDRALHRKILVKDLLRMSSGLSWSEGYEATPFDSDVLAMLYTVGRSDMARYTARQEAVHPRDTTWKYSSGTSNLLMGMLKNIVGMEHYDAYPWERLFDVLGMKDVVFEQDGSGTFVGSSYLYATPRDYAKFGYLYLQNGMWEGQRLLPQGWVKFTTTLAPAFLSTALTDSMKRNRPGAHWWLNVEVPELNLGRAWPALPEDAFAALGHWGQYIFVVPSLEMVIIRTGDDRDKTFDRKEFLRLIAASLEPGGEE